MKIAERETMLGLVITTLIVTLASMHSQITARKANDFTFPYQAQPAPFLESPYYGTQQVNCVYDHQYPLFSNEGNVVSQTVFHYDNTIWRGTVNTCTIGTPSCYSGHNGIDYSLSYEPVRAAAHGNVVNAEWGDPANHRVGVGLYVRIEHNNGYSTLYGHMSALYVKRGEEIGKTNERQRVLGISGNTGRSDGSHLHFELEPPNSRASVNPYGWMGGSANDPWEVWTRNNWGIGLASHNVWADYPSITNNDVYPSGEPITAPEFDENAIHLEVDDGDTDFFEEPAGCWTVDTTLGRNGDHRHRVYTQGSECTATWRFPSSSQAKTYDLFIYVPENNATTDAARYTVYHTVSIEEPWLKQQKLVIINQHAYPNDHHPSNWVYAGTYYSDSQYGSDYVRLESEPLSYEGDQEPITLAADAVRFVPHVEPVHIHLPLVARRWPPIPYTPALHPIDNPHRNPDYAVRWDSAQLADAYTLEEATRADFGDAQVRYTGTGTTWSAQGQPTDSYHYRVRATNGYGSSGWSAVQATEVLPPLPAVPTLHPISTAPGSNTYTVAWTTVDHADGYQLLETHDNDHANARIYDVDATARAFSDQSTGSYEYRVRSHNARGTSAWSAPQTTVVHPTGWQIVTAQDFESSSAFPGDWDLYDKNGYADGQYRWGRRDCKTSGSDFSGWATGGGLNGAQTACGANYPNSVESWMVYGPFDLSQVVAAELNLRTWYDTERFRDYLYVLASVDDDTFYGERTYGPSYGWRSLTLNLDRASSLGSLLGQPQVWVALAFESDSSGTRPEGVHVDDVLLRVCLREPCPQSMSDPTVVTEPAFKRRPRAGE